MDDLGVPGAKKIIVGCLGFIEKYLLRSPSKVRNDALELFADVISSLEFYLDTLKYTTSPSVRILEFAEKNHDKLNTMIKTNGVYVED